MSGRVRTTLADGRRVTGFRKTLRQNPRRDPRERLTELAGSGDWPVRMVFRLPKTLEGFVAPGRHGIGIEVLGRGYVRTGAASSTECFLRARMFFAAIARDRPAFTTHAIVIGNAEPGRSFGRFIVVVAGAMVVCASLSEPEVYEAA